MTPADDQTGRTPAVPVRVDPELWAAFGRVVGERQRSATLRTFMQWVVRAHEFAQQEPGHDAVS
jgi:hypothetical protein